MKSKLLTIAITLATILQGIGQVPQKISYQAVLRNSDGTVIASQPVNVKITLRKAAADGTVVYTETINQTTTAQGVVNLSVGGGDAVSFAAIPWDENIFIQTEVKKESDASFQDLGTTQILSVPYALTAGYVKEVKSASGTDDAIFEVKNNNGQVVFGVYQNGVRMYVDNVGIKGAKGGFAVGGLTGKEIEGNYYLQITPDSARINITSGGKGAKGGFAVGGLTGKSSNDFFRVTSDTSYFTTTVYTESNIVSTGTVQTGIGVNSVALTDIDGNIYKTVKIGSQVWMKENLKVTKYSDGTALSTANEVGNYNFVSDASDTIKNYGRIYSYNVVLSPLNVCPTGWHVPTDADWNLLLEFVGGVDWSSNRLLTGLKLMEKGTISGLDGFWDTTINKANDLSGFSARPGGLGDASASWSFFSYLGTIGYWWSVTSPTSAQVYSIDSSGYLDFTEASNLSGYSVRCVKDF